MGSTDGTGIKIPSKLRLFLSLDIVGSTEFKHPRGAKAPSDGDSWVDPFLAFYRVSVDQMAVQWELVVEELKAAANGSNFFKFGKGPEFWKGAGDEVLFTKLVKSPLDAVAAVRSLILVMADIGRLFARNDRTKVLAVKGTAWLAGFPLNNTEIVLGAQNGPEVDDPLTENYRLLAQLDKKSKQRGSYKVDYIGPSIDLGFRLCQRATPRRMMVSADLAWLVCHVYRQVGNAGADKCPSLEKPKIGFDGRVALKGLLGGEAYPLFWIEAVAGSRMDNVEDRLLKRPAHVEHDDVRKFCKEFLDQSGPLRTKPYIDGYTASELGKRTPDRQKRLRELEERVNKTVIGIKEEKEDIAGTRGNATVGAKKVPSRPKAFAMDAAGVVQAKKALKSRKTAPRPSPAPKKKKKRSPKSAAKGRKPKK